MSIAPRSTPRTAFHVARRVPRLVAASRAPLRPLSIVAFGALLFVGRPAAVAAASGEVARGPDFAAHVAVPTAPAPTTFTVGDLDGDGHLDLVVGEAAAPAIAWFAGRGDGSFALRGRSATGRAPSSIRLHDLDGDGALDAIVTREGSKDVAVFPSDGRGGFGAARRVRLPGVASPGILEIVDLDADGLPDLVAATGEFLCFGTAGPAGAIPEEAFALEVENDVSALAPIDFDGDGAIDLAFSDDRGLAILPGNGRGAFDRPRRVERSGPAATLRAVDIDFDGQADLIATAPGTGTISVYRGLGPDGFATPVTTEIGDRPVIAHPTDLDLDGVPELLVSSRGGVGFSVLRGSGGVRFERTRDYGIGRDPVSFAVADFDHDELPDMAILCRDSARVEIVRREGRTHSISPTRLPAAIRPTRVRVGDLDRDGHDDVVVARTDGITVLGGAGHGLFEPPRPTAFGSRPSAMELGDFDGDGRTDVVIGAGAERRLRWMRGLADGKLGEPRPVEAGTGATHLAVADLLGGPGDELVALAPGSGLLTVIAFEAPDAADSIGTANALGPTTEGGAVDPDTADPDTAEAGARAPRDGPPRAADRGGPRLPSVRIAASVPVGTRPSPVVAADFDDDGHGDLAFFQSSPNGITVLRGDGNGTFEATSTGFDLPLANLLAAADVDGDGWPDLVAAGPTTKPTILRGDGSGGFASAGVIEGVVGAEALAIRDFDEDGHADLAFVSGGGLRIAPGRGSGRFGEVLDFAAGAEPSDLAVGRFHADGRLDLAVVSTGDESVFVLRNRSFDGIDTRRGNAGAAVGPPERVLTVNGEAGAGPERIVRVGPDDPFELRIDVPRSAGERAVGYCVWVWTEAPTSRTVRRLPGRTGRAGLATPLEAPFGRQPVLVVNRLPGRRELGRDRWPVPAPAAAPALLSDGRDGFPPGRFYVQGVVVDAKSPSGRLAVTNGILVEWTP